MNEINLKRISKLKRKKMLGIIKLDRFLVKYTFESGSFISFPNNLKY
jgi:hypothetical protein